MAERKVSVTCIVCPVGCKIEVDICNGKVVNVEGNACIRGLNYAKEECTSPKRVLTTLVSVKGGNLPVTSVKTTKPIPKELIGSAQMEISKITLAAPVSIGELVLRNLLGTGADVVVTRSVRPTEAERGCG
jgi:CxxC motif-containing protein